MASVTQTKSKSINVYLLVLLMAFESVGALYGGFNLINDPTGESIKLSLELLDNTVFNNYMIPGLILFLVLGFFPLFLLYPLLFKPQWPIMDVLNIYSRYYWAWTYTLYSSIILISWINIQILILDSTSMFQGIFGLLGVLILIITLSPGVKRYYKVRRHSTHREVNQD